MQKTLKSTVGFAILLVVTTLSNPAHAAIMFVNNGFDVVNNRHTATVTFDPITVTTSASNPGNVYLVFSDFFGMNSLVDTTSLSGSFEVAINGLSPQTIATFAAPLVSQQFCQVCLTPMI